MKITLTFVCFLCISFKVSSQIQGIITDSKKEPLSSVNIYLENTFSGTTSNEKGLYELPISKKGKYNIIFQYIGYKTFKTTITIESFPYELNVLLNEENIQLNEVVIGSKENPANRIIRNAIEKRVENSSKITQFTSDFYSKGIYRIKNAPKKILGQKLGDLGGGLDSTRSGVIYLSETFSKITFKQPDHFKEQIIASKVSGNNSGFSFNQASEVNFDFYKNTVELGSQLISPIANYAFNYYNYKLIGTFYEGTLLINKIKVTPKRKNDNAFNGTIYISEDDWAIYALDLSVLGTQMNQPVLDSLNLKHNYSYTEKEKTWALRSQQIYFKFGMIGIHIDGQFNTSYSNYNFSPALKKKEFTNEISTFTENANKKDSIFWESNRPMLLTAEERKDYKIKDSIQLLKKSEKYLDSIDQKNNKFKLGSLLFGYSYKNSHKNSNLSFSSLLSDINFNTVQGWNSGLKISYTKRNKEKESFFSTSTNFNYGLSDEKLRATASAQYLFNSISKPFLKISGGKKITQFNENEPISPTINSIATLYFEDNFAKFYDKTFAEIIYSEELFNGFKLQSSLSYENRSPLVNTTNYVALNKDKIYTSNDPLNETNYNIPSFEEHHIYKFKSEATINFGQKYISFPNRKINTSNSNFPTVVLGYSQNFAASENDYNFSEFNTQIHQNFNISNKGSFSYNIKAGTFFNADSISFIDYNHFNGNQTHVFKNSNQINSFKLMPYYNFSTNKSYAEFHGEHNFNGYLLNKIPLLNKLGLEFIIGAKSLLTTDKKPYSEFSIGLNKIGIGKLRILRLDYVKSINNGDSQNGLVLGLTF